MYSNILKERAFSLVLSGGGALGIAHLGILHDMEKISLRPAEIVGTSMGGIVGACMAIGLTEAEIYTHIEAFGRITKWMKLTLSGNAIVDNRKIAQIFEGIFGDRKMYQTDIPLKLVATDLLDGTIRTFSSRDRTILIKDALLATMAIPGIFSEHAVEGRLYADGFLCANLAVCDATYETILAVDVLGRHAFEDTMPENFLKTVNVLEMFERSMRLLIYNQTQTLLQLCHDREILLLEPVTRGYKTFQFHKATEIRKLGLEILR